MKRVKANWTEVVLVCRKCSKKLRGGFGPTGGQAFGKALRKTLAGSGRKAGKTAQRRRDRVAVIEVGCLDVCPKNAVVALRAGAPAEWLVVPRGADMAGVAADLGLQPAEAVHTDARDRMLPVPGRLDGLWPPTA